MRRWRNRMRWRKVEGQRFHSLDKRGYRRDRVRIRRYSKWRGDSYRWMRIVNIMDVWVKRRVHVEGRGGGEGEPGDVLDRVGRERECSARASRFWVNDYRQ
jgi:hypothetical protein